MTISATSRMSGPYLGDGVTVKFPYSFRVLAAADVGVVLTDADLNDTTLSQAGDFTVTVLPNQTTTPGGFVVLTSAPAKGMRVTVVSAIAATQGVALTNLGGFFPAVIEAAFDKLTMLIQQLERRVDHMWSSSVVTTTQDAVSRYIGAARDAASAALGFASNADLSAASAAGSARYATEIATTSAQWAQRSEEAAAKATAPSAAAISRAIGVAPNHVFADIYASAMDFGGIMDGADFLDEVIPSRRVTLAGGDFAIDFGTLF